MISIAPRFVVPRIVKLRVPKGRSGTLHTARLIGKLTQDGAKDFVVRQKAIEIFRTRGVRAKDRFGEVCALFDWVRRNVRYTRDIFRVELLHTARRMLELRAGDCDDMTILLGAMLLSTGHPVRLILAGFRPERPHVYSHIYPEVHVAGRWLPVDATISRPIGWAPPALWKRVCDLTQEGIRCLPKTP
jgi:transglutaminase-like putative cysteine protease